MNQYALQVKVGWWILYNFKWIIIIKFIDSGLIQQPVTPLVTKIIKRSIVLLSAPKIGKRRVEVIN